MCRMIAAPLGAPGDLLIAPFLRMARGENAINEHNTKVGQWTHANGWGAVYEEDGELKTLRSTEPCWDDPAIESLRDRRLFLLHARRASLGAVSLANTHPFDADVVGKRFFFCHNGTVRDLLPTPPTLAKAEPTDSERIFHRLIPYVRDGRTLEGFREVYGGFRDYTCLNTFLLGPEELWAVCLFTRDPAYYALALATSSHGPIVSSEPLAEFAGDRRPIASGTAVRVDRRSGAIGSQALA
jgi:predicted glutamine amidotransferase